jgi:hypothetical protein
MHYPYDLSVNSMRNPEKRIRIGDNGLEWCGSVRRWGACAVCHQLGGAPLFGSRPRGTEQQSEMIVERRLRGIEPPRLPVEPARDANWIPVPVKTTRQNNK